MPVTPQNLLSQIFRPFLRQVIWALSVLCEDENRKRNLLLNEQKLSVVTQGLM